MTTTLAVACTITRQEVPGGPLADLNLEDNTNYKLIGVGPGAIEWDRQYATSRFVHGEYLTNAVKRQGTLPLSVRVKGGTQAIVNTNLAALLRALEQFTYSISVTIEGISYKWNCDPADYNVDENNGEFSKFHRLAKQTIVTAQVPRHPTPAIGSI